MGFVILRILLTGVCLWLPMRYLTKANASIVIAILIAAISEVVAWIPVVGPVLFFIVMLVLVVKLCDADIWPDAILAVGISGVIYEMLKYGLYSLADSIEIVTTVTKQ